MLLIAGVLSFLIMVLYPKIRNKYLQMVPAPMWIVITYLSDLAIILNC